MKKNEIQNNDEEEMFDYRFIEIDVMHEHIEIFNITAGCEDDAFELANENQESNFGTMIRLTDKMVKQMYDEIQKVKDII